MKLKVHRASGQWYLLQKVFGFMWIHKAGPFNTKREAIRAWVWL